jgi:threonine aldolase
MRGPSRRGHYYLYPGDTPLDGDPDTPVRCRLVCDWSKTEAEVDALIASWMT